MSDEARQCESCGASVYKEHLDMGIARHHDGKLLCKHCVEEYESAHDVSSGGIDDHEAEFSPIEFDDHEEEVTVDMSESRIHALSTGTLGMAGGWDDTRYSRALDPRSFGACRCRTFHSKLSEAAIEFMNNQINEWIDSNQNIVVKFATSTIGPFEGKHTEPNLILTVFY